MAAKYWIKLYHEMLDDPKMGRLSDRLYRRTIECFLLAGDEDMDGELPSVNDMAWRLRCDPEHLETELIELSRVGILSQHDGGWFVTKFAERQATMSKAEYMRRKRESDQKAEHYDRTYGEPLRDSYQSVTNGNAEKNRKEKNRTETDAAAAVFNAYGDLCGFTSITATIAEKINAYVDELGATMVIEAIDEAAVQNVRKWAYIEAILKNWRDNGKGAGKANGDAWAHVMELVTAGTPPDESDPVYAAVKTVGWGKLKQMTPYDEQKLRNAFEAVMA